MPPFQGGTFNHSATLPRCSLPWLGTEKTKYTQIFEKVCISRKKIFFARCARDAIETPEKKKDAVGRDNVFFEILAEGEGFEPSIRNFRMPPFQGGTFNHSATLPRCSMPWLGIEDTQYTGILKNV